MFEDIFYHKKVRLSTLKDYGFTYKDNSYIMEQPVMDGVFTLLVHIDSEGLPDTKLIENDTGEEYVLYKTDAQGAYVGDVRKAVEEVLKKIVDACYETAVFKTKQAQAVIDFVRDTYGDEFEYLWQKFPDNAVVRRKDNKKWYAALLTASRRKLGMDSDETAEILDLRMKPEDIEAVTDNKKYFPGYHMNKKHWITICLDGTVSVKEICSKIDESYKLALK